MIIHVLGKKETSPEKVIIRVGLACFAWIALGFQTAAMVLLGRSLKVFAPGPVYLAILGLVASAVFVVFVVFVGMMSERKGRKKLSILWTLGGLVPWSSHLGTPSGKRFFVVGWLSDIATRYLQIQRRQGPVVGRVLQQTGSRAEI